VSHTLSPAGRKDWPEKRRRTAVTALELKYAPAPQPIDFGASNGSDLSPGGPVITSFVTHDHRSQVLCVVGVKNARNNPSTCKMRRSEYHDRPAFVVEKKQSLPLFGCRRKETPTFYRVRYRAPGREASYWTGFESEPFQLGFKLIDI
jgi:hypothetical protein